MSREDMNMQDRDVSVDLSFGKIQTSRSDLSLASDDRGEDLQ